MAWPSSIQDYQTGGNRAQGKFIITITFLSCLSSAAKVGHVTCDNASNNSTMMKEFSAQLKTATGKKYNWRKRKIKCTSPRTYHTQLLISNSCLAHVINLATQALISTYSKSPHFDPKQPDAHIPTSRDEVGLVWAIVVKVCIGTPSEKKYHRSPMVRSAHHPNEKKCGEPFRLRQIIGGLFNSSLI